MTGASLRPAVLAVLVLAASASAMQQAEPLTLARTVSRALEQYPAVRVSRQQVEAAAAGIALARTAYLPRLDALAQVNRATRNNVFGLLFPQPVVAPISGPPLAVNSGTTVWGSAVGFLASWEPFDFGVRRAEVAVAEAAVTRAEAGVARTRLEVATLAADQFLTLLAAGQVADSARAALARTETLLPVVDALVRAELRPGADLSRSHAERAVAQAQVIRAEQALAESRAALGALLGVEPAQVTAQAGPLLGRLPEPLTGHAATHPAVIEQQAVVRESETRLAVLARSYAPRFELQGTTYARGTGALPDGATLGGLNGLGPNIVNYGVGFTATFPIGDRPALRARQAVEAARLRGEQERQAQVEIDLAARRNAAIAAEQAARLLIATTAEQRAAARASLEQATARYRAGLASVVDVADAQRLLTAAEIDDRLARLAVWRAQLAVSAASGDLAPFLQEAAR